MLNYRRLQAFIVLQGFVEALLLPTRGPWGVVSSAVRTALAHRGDSGRPATSSADRLSAWFRPMNAPYHHAARTPGEAAPVDGPSPPPTAAKCFTKKE
ncbi:hypothetical protein AB0M41_05060 [Streptomyces sp. NPDC051896]|uniref:hypothetical protein n=1 Tax=Streptomyces sp. NPDC051896 TaxID=3155416 RepID=UPI00343D6E74